MPLNHFGEWHWEVTRKCNLRCSHCITSCGAKSGAELSEKEALLAIARLVELGCREVMFTGGEPLVRKDILEILQAFKASGVRTRLLTNGFAVDRYKASLLCGLVCSAGVSIDGSCSKVHDAIRGRGSFEQAHRAISLFSGRMPVSAYVTVSSNNIRELPKLFKKTKSLGVSYIHVTEISLFGRAAANERGLSLDKSQRRELRLLAEDMTGNRGETGCNIDLSSVYLSSTGLVYPCSEVAVKKPDSFIANIRSPSFAEEMKGLPLKFKASGGECCYTVFSGNEMMFCLSSESPCCLMRRRKQ